MTTTGPRSTLPLDGARRSDPQAWRAASNLLVLRLDNLGDVLMTEPAVVAIRAERRNVRVTLMASPAGAQAAALLPCVDAVITARVLWQDISGGLDFDPEREQALIAEVATRRFDAAIILTSFSQSPLVAAYFCYLAGIPLRAGESKEQGGATLTDALGPAPDELHQVDRNLRLIEALGFEPTRSTIRLQVPSDAASRSESILRQFGLARRGFVLWNPFASAAARTYPLEAGVEAAHRLARATGLRVVVTGSGKQVERARPLIERLGPASVDLVGKTSFVELAALVERAGLVLTNNTSTLHLADAFGVPTVVTYSGTDLESQWQPRNAPSAVLRRPTWCSPCYAFNCPYGLECLDIDPAEIEQAGLRLLGAGTPEVA